MNHLLGILAECWHILAESAPYVLFGFFAAGILKALIPDEAVARHLGASDARSVIKASLFGIPLPLCSCGVIPAAIGLRKQGASKGASVAFLVSTPESGVDSIAITWALLDPLMTLIRPISALFTATTAGLLINRLPEEAPSEVQPAGADSCGCSGGTCGETAEAAPPRPPMLRRMHQGLGYAFGEMLQDIGRWLLIGIAVAGLIAYLVPDDFFARTMGSEFLSLLIMLLAGIPLYICASASTPIAAALVLKGLSPGAALVFLLAGPATNAATITVVTRFWGRKATAVYLAAIASCSLLLGWVTNRIYTLANIDITTWVTHTGEAPPGAISTAAALLLLALIGRGYLPRKKHSDSCGCDH